MGFNRERGLPRVPTVHVTRMHTSLRARYHFMGCVRVRNRHLLCHSKVLQSAPFLQSSQANNFSYSFLKPIFLSSSFRKQCLEYGLPVACHRALLCPQRHLRVMRSQRLLSVLSRSMISATGVRTLAWTTPAERRTWLPACSSTTTSSAPSLVHQPPVNHRCNVTTRTSRGSWTTPFATRYRSEVTACVTAAVQNLLPSSSSTIDLTGNAGLLRPTHGQIGSRSTSVSLPTASVPSRTADRILRGEYIDFNDLLPEALGLAQHPAGQLRLQIGDHGAVLLADQGTSSTRVKRHVHDSAPGWRHGQRTCTSSYRLPPREPRSFSLTKRL